MAASWEKLRDWLAEQRENKGGVTKAVFDEKAAEFGAVGTQKGKAIISAGFTKRVIGKKTIYFSHNTAPDKPEPKGKGIPSAKSADLEPLIFEGDIKEVTVDGLTLKGKRIKRVIIYFSVFVGLLFIMDIPFALQGELSPQAKILVTIINFLTT